MATTKSGSKSTSIKKTSSGAKKPVVKAAPVSKTPNKNTASKVTRAGDNQLKLNIDYKTLLTLLPLVLPLIGKITGSNNGTIEFEKESSTGELLGYVLKLVSGKSGETLLSLDSANNTQAEKSELGNILALLGNAVGGSTGSQLLDAVTDGKQDESALGGILDLLGGALK